MHYVREHACLYMNSSSRRPPAGTGRPTGRVDRGQRRLESRRAFASIDRTSAGTLAGGAQRSFTQQVHLARELYLPVLSRALATSMIKFWAPRQTAGLCMHGGPWDGHLDHYLILSLAIHVYSYLYVYLASLLELEQD